MIRHTFVAVALAAATGGAVHSFQDSARPQTGAPAPTPVIAFSVIPDYPALARRARVGADVVVAITVGTDGRAAGVRVTRSSPLLDVAALLAAQQWRFEAPPPGTTPVVPVTFRFSITAFAPATASASRGPGVPQDFAIQYKYSCAAGMVEVDSSRPLIAELSRGHAAVTRAMVIAPDEEARLYTDLVARGFFKLAPPLGPALSPGLVVSERGIEVTVDSGPPLLEEVTTAPARNPPAYSHLLQVRRNGSVHILTWDEPAAADATAQQYSSIGAAVRDVVTRANGGATSEPGRNVCR